MISVGNYYDDAPVCREQLSRRLLEGVWLLHHGLTQEKVAQVVGIGLATVNRHAKAYRDGGPDGLRHWGKKGQVSSLEAHRELLAETFRERPVSSVAEAADRTMNEFTDCGRVAWTCALVHPTCTDDDTEQMTALRIRNCANVWVGPLVRVHEGPMLHTILDTRPDGTTTALGNCNSTLYRWGELGNTLR